MPGHKKKLRRGNDSRRSLQEGRAAQYCVEPEDEEPEDEESGLLGFSVLPELPELLGGVVGIVPSRVVVEVVDSFMCDVLCRLK